VEKHFEKRPKRLLWVVLGVIVVGVAAWLTFGPGPSLVWDSIQHNLESWQEIAERNPLLAVALFFVVYAVAASLPLPVLTIMSLLAGALFGRPLGIAVASVAYTAGVTVAFLTARALLQERVRRYSSKWRDRIEHGIERDGGFYLLTLRLMPSIPFFLVNVLMALTPIRTRSYVLASWIGVLPLTILYTNVGTELATIQSPADVLSWPLIASLVALAFVPMIVRKVLRRRSENQLSTI